MSCGTPVLSFKMTALNSLIKNGKNGYKTEKIIKTTLSFSRKYKIKKIKKKWEKLFNK